MMYEDKTEIINSEMDEDLYNDGFEYNEQALINTNKKKAVIALVIFFVVVGFFAFQYPKIVEKLRMPKLPDSANISAAAHIDTNELVAQADNDNMGDYFFNEAGGESQSVAANSASDNKNDGSNGGGNENSTESAINFDSQEDHTIMLTLGNTARKNPFMPSTKVMQQGVTNLEFDKLPFEIIEPPTTFTVDPNISKILETKITGIMYDTRSPSAVVMIDGTEEFVKKGDLIFGCKIIDITPNKVVLSYAQNTYSASIGQLFSQSDMTKERVVSNLEKKFGGERIRRSNY